MWLTQTTSSEAGGGVVFSYGTKYSVLSFVLNHEDIIMEQTCFSSPAEINPTKRRMEKITEP
jgi:hypothetical protein